MAQDNQDIKYEEEFITNSRGTKLFTCGWIPVNTEPKALIFICHGLAAECSISMSGTATRLAKANYSVYGIDYEGHGKSAGLRCYISNFDELVTDCSIYFTSLCEKAENRKKRRYLFGFSMGGAVAILLHRKQPSYWNGAVLVSPMCKIADEMKPGPILFKALNLMCKLVPTWRILPSKDIIDKVCKSPEFREEIRSNPYVYKKNLPLKTGQELLMISLDIEKNLHQVSIPFLVLHGGDDIVTDPSVSKLLYESASSRDKTFKLYPEMWHALMAESPEDVELVFSDIISWLNDRASMGDVGIEKIDQENTE